jgi:hypothetical protein
MAGWPSIDFDRDPRMILGFRSRSRRLDGRRMDVHEDAFADLRTVCEPTADQLRAATARPYEPFAQLEPTEEYFRVEIDDLPQRPPPRRRGRRQDDGNRTAAHKDLDGTADLVRLVRSVDQLEPLGGLDDAAYTFYAICWPVDGGFVGFVKKHDPRRALTAGRRWFQYGDALRHAEPPDLVLESDIDIVVTSDFVATRNPTAFKHLLNDVQVVLAGVPADVKAVRRRLQRTMPLSGNAAKALEQAARQRVSYARRLNLLPDRIKAIQVDVAKLRKELQAVGVPAGRLLGADEGFDFGVDDVGVFLDVLEARYFDDRLGGERRRADRYSRRS